MAYEKRTMPPKELEAFLNKPYIGVIATMDDENRPRLAPIWYQWENGAAHMFTFRNSLKWRNLEKRPYASLCIDHRQLPYAMVAIDGVIEETDRSVYDLILAMATRYLGEEEGPPFAEDHRENKYGSVTFKLIPHRIISQGPDLSSS